MKFFGITFFITTLLAAPAFAGSPEENAQAIQQQLGRNQAAHIHVTPRMRQIMNQIEHNGYRTLVSRAQKIP